MVKMVNSNHNSKRPYTKTHTNLFIWENIKGTILETNFMILRWRYSRLILCFPCPSPRIGYFSKKSWFLLLDLATKIWVLDLATTIATGVSLPPLAYRARYTHIYNSVSTCTIINLNMNSIRYLLDVSNCNPVPQSSFLPFLFAYL